MIPVIVPVSRSDPVWNWMAQRAWLKVSDAVPVPPDVYCWFVCFAVIRSGWLAGLDGTL